MTKGQLEINNELGQSARREVIRVLKKWDPSLFVIEMRLENAYTPEPLDNELKQRLQRGHWHFNKAVEHIHAAIKELGG